MVKVESLKLESQVFKDSILSYNGWLSSELSQNSEWSLDLRSVGGEVMV